jgi:hypothetical protein
MSRAQTSDATTAAPAVTVDGLAEVVLNVRDMAAALAFYRDLLGCGSFRRRSGRPRSFFKRALPRPESRRSWSSSTSADAAAFTPPRTLHHLR